MTDSSNPLISEVLARLEQFTEEELVHLNQLIVERLRIMQHVRAHNAMIQFRIGQRVKFTDNTGQEVRGTLTKYNRKSVTVVTDDGMQWTVSPSLLQPA